MNIRNKSILIHISNSDHGYLLISELYKLENQLLVVGKCENHLNQLKKEFPKIDHLVCDVKREADIDALVMRCARVYPFLDNVVHHNYPKDLIESPKIQSDIEEYLLDAEKLSIRLLPIFSNKAKSSMVITQIDTESLKYNPKTNHIHPTHDFVKLKEKIAAIPIELIHAKVPIELLKIDHSEQHLKAIHHIHDNLYAWERGNYTRLKTNESAIKKWLNWFKRSYLSN